MRKIRQWIQYRRDRRFLRQLERVFNNHVVKAEPTFDGAITCRELNSIGFVGIIKLKERIFL